MLFQGKELPISLLKVDTIETYDAPKYSSRAPVLWLETSNGYAIYAQHKLGKYQGHYYMRVVSESQGRPFNDFTPDQLEEVNNILKVLNG